MTGQYNIELDAKYILSQPDENGNETNPDYSLLLDKYAMNIIKRNWPYKITDDTNKVQATVMSLVLQEFLMIKQFGGKVEGYNPMIRVAEADIDNEIPEGLPNRTDAEGNIRTWRTWRDDTHPLPEPEDIDGTLYYTFVSYTFGKALTDDELLIIYNSPDAQLIDI